MEDLGLIFITKASRFLYLIMVGDRWVRLRLYGKDSKTVLSVIGQALYGGELLHMMGYCCSQVAAKQLSEDSRWMRELDPSLTGLCRTGVWGP